MGNRTLCMRGRTLLAGKVIFNYGQSTIDRVVRRITEEGATIELQSGQGVPACFQLSIAGEVEPLPCRVMWQSEKQFGVCFEEGQALNAAQPETMRSEELAVQHALRSQTLALRDALEHVPLGIVLLDPKLNPVLSTGLSGECGLCLTRSRTVTHPLLRSCFTGAILEPTTFLQSSCNPILPSASLL